jgi:hypothetical protein
MAEEKPDMNRCWARVIGCVTPGCVDVIVGPSIGMLDGGIHTQLPIDMVPIALRMPNTEFIVVLDPRLHKIVAVEPLDQDSICSPNSTPPHSSESTPRLSSSDSMPRSRARQKPFWRRLMSGAAGMSARKAYYIHVLVFVMLIVAGMSETYHWLNWTQPLIALVSPLLLVSIVMPIEIVRLATKEQQFGFKVSAAALLSIAMTIASFLAIIPLM